MMQEDRLSVLPAKPVAAFRGHSRLPCLLSGKPQALALGIGLPGVTSFRLTEADTIHLDFAKAGVSLALDPGQFLCPGWSVASWQDGQLTLRADGGEQWWLEGAQLFIEFGAATGTVIGKGRLGVVPLTVTLAGTGVLTGDAPLVILGASAESQELHLTLQDTEGYVVEPVHGSRVKEDLPMVVTLANRKPWRLADNGEIHILPITLDGGGLSALASASQLSEMRITLWREPAKRPRGDGVPLWSFVSNEFSEATIAAIGDLGPMRLRLKMSRLPTRLHPGIGHIAVFTLGIDGAPDSYGIVKIRRLAASFTPSLTVSPANLSFQPNAQSVSLSWDATGAAYATLTTLTGFRQIADQVLGQVALTGNSVQAYVESTTTFVLTAYNASFSQVLSASAQVVMTPETLDGVIAPNTIMPWYGSVTPPTGWRICDGTQNTPNLSGKFIMGAAQNTMNTSQSGGGKHSHVLNTKTAHFTTGSVAAHSHTPPSGWSATTCITYNSCKSNQPVVISIGGTSGFSTTTVSAADKHSHTVTYTPQNVATNQNTSPIIPPYYAMYYIIYVGASA